jgi:addiction module RelE/StbE family toxin
MRIRWTPSAVADLQSIGDYLKLHHPRYRDATLRKLYAAAQALRHWPNRGRIGAEDGTREILFPPLPYVLVYRVRHDTLEVLRIYHGAQNRPSH